MRDDGQLVVVTGGRNYDDEVLVRGVLDSIHALTPIACVVTGACRTGGADLLAENWAKNHEIEYIGKPAQFKKFGPRGGPIRNTHMLVLYLPDLVIAFPGGAGTQDCVRKAKRLGIEVKEYGADVHLHPEHL